MTMTAGADKHIDVLRDAVLRRVAGIHRRAKARVSSFPLYRQLCGDIGQGWLINANAPMPCRNCRRDTMRVLPNSKLSLKQVDALRQHREWFWHPDRVQSALNRCDERFPRASPRL
jgi:hypothetical protein